MPTAAPWAGRTRAMLGPIGPVAPVINAFLPVSSNMASSHSPAGSAACGLEPGDVLGRTDRGHVGRFRDPLDQSGEHLAGTGLVKGGNACLHHAQDRFTPATVAGHLL